MVRSCLLCKNIYRRDSNLTFHIFPADQNMRKNWFESIEKEYEDTKYIYLCSNHFSSHDFVTKFSGHRYLRQNAVPSVACKSQQNPSKRFRRATQMVFPETERTPPSSPTHQGRQEGEIYILPMATQSISSPSTSSTTTAAGSPIKRISNIVGQTSSRTSSSTISVTDPEHDVEPIPHKKRFKRPRYFGDCDDLDMQCTKKTVRNWKIAKRTISAQRQKILQLQRNNRRYKSRVSCIKSLLNYLRTQNFISEGGAAVLTESVPGPAGEILKRALQGPTRQKFSPQLRTFALTLNFYSTKAYNYVREKFNRSLPSTRTLCNWYRSIESAPGFTAEAAEALKLKVKQASAEDKKVLCGMIIDEMSIKKMVEWTGKKFTGFVDIGTNLDSDNLPEAKEVLVFMLVAVNDNWKITIGYFLLDGLSGSEKAQLVNKSLEFLHDTGVIILALTFDGAASNINMAKSLGANFSDPENLITKFQHPITQQDIYLFLDICHMLKLLRNCLGSQGSLIDNEGKIIEWKYFEYLVELQNLEGLHAATKLRNRHIRWEQEKMKVKLAAQTFSNSVGDAMLFLGQDLQLEHFKNVEATANFCKIVNNLFDIFNCRNLLSKSVYRKPLSMLTENKILPYLEYCREYILNLKLKGQPVVCSNRKIGFLGFLVGIESLKGIYTNYVKCNAPLLKYILTYKFSQDHLEMYFSIVRSKGGSNNNPTARQFETIYKRLLVHSELKGIESGNVTAIDDTSILHVGSSSKKSVPFNCPPQDHSYSKNFNVLHFVSGSLIENDEDRSELNFNAPVEQDHEYLSSNAWHLTVYSEDILGYIAGFVVKKIKNIIACDKCLELLEDATPFSQLQKRKTYGNMVKASKFVSDICKAGERYFRFIKHSQNIFNPNIALIKTLINRTLSSLPTTLFSVFGDHIYDDDPISNHSILLSELILTKYFNLRIHHETTVQRDIKEYRIRSLLTKTITFKNQ